jgi:hypothetical protein
MKARKITIADACEITGYTRNQVRALLRDLPAFVGQGGKSPSVRTFTRNELLMICVIAQMEVRFGIRRAAIGCLIQKLADALQVPRTAGTDARLDILFEPPSVTYSTAGDLITEGVLIPLAPILERIEQYLGGYTDLGVQGELPLGPVLWHDIRGRELKA